MHRWRCMLPPPIHPQSTVPRCTANGSAHCQGTPQGACKEICNKTSQDCREVPHTLPTLYPSCVRLSPPTSLSPPLALSPSRHAIPASFAHPSPVIASVSSASDVLSIAASLVMATTGTPHTRQPSAVDHPIDGTLRILPLNLHCTHTGGEQAECQAQALQPSLGALVAFPGLRLHKQTSGAGTALRREREGEG